MPTLSPHFLSPEARESLRREFLRLPKEITPFSEQRELAAWVACLGIQREVGTVNDELARFIFDAEKAEPVPREKLKAEWVLLGNSPGLRVFCEGVPHLEIRAPFLQELIHPRFSYNQEGALMSLVLFPEIIAEITRREGVEPVLVKTWGENSIFGGFNPSQGYYQTNFWELENNDTLLFSHLLKNNQLAFLGTHDLVAHLAGLRAERWPALKVQANRAHSAIRTYFHSAEKPSIASLIVPYTLGVVLDDLAQPPSYDSPSHLAVLDSLLQALLTTAIDPSLKTLLTEFPPQFEKLIALSRLKGSEKQPLNIDATLKDMVSAIQSHAFFFPGN